MDFIIFTMITRGCKRSADDFCYICGKFIKFRGTKIVLKKHSSICQAYHFYFGIPIGDQNKKWAPHVSCGHCSKTLLGKINLSNIYIIYNKIKERDCDGLVNIRIGLENSGIQYYGVTSRSSRFSGCIEGCLFVGWVCYTNCEIRRRLSYGLGMFW